MGYLWSRQSRVFRTKKMESILSHPHLPFSVFSSPLMITAPSTRAVAVGNAVRSPKKSLFDALPKFLADAFGIVATGEVVTDGNFIVDEECYLGKDGNLDECVDFDPTHSSP